jgi:glycosyltransferase involved in cell wall biosynthesis
VTEHHVGDSVSVIVAFHNAAATVVSCLDSLVAQADDRVEIVLVDDASTDGGSVLVGQGRNVRLIRQARGGAYVARNRGVQESHGSLVLFTDADCVADARWIATVREAMRDPRVQVVLGRRLAPPGARSLGLVFDYEHARDRYVLESSRPELYYGHANNMAIRRATFERLGPFVVPMRGSDSVLVRRVVDECGCDAVVYRPDALVTHLELGGLWAYYRKVFTYGRHRRLTRALGSARALSARDRREVAALAARSGRYGLARRVGLWVVLVGGMLAWSAGSSSAPLTGHSARLALRRATPVIQSRRGS